MNRSGNKLRRQRMQCKATARCWAWVENCGQSRLRPGWRWGACSRPAQRDESGTGVCMRGVCGVVGCGGDRETGRGAEAECEKG